MTRFPPLAIETLNPAQARMAAVAQHSGPFQAFLRAPLLWERLQGVRRYLMDESQLSPAVREAVVLVLAHRLGSPAMAKAHHRMALDAGLSAQEIAAIAQGAPESVADQAGLAACAAEALLARGRLDDVAFAALITGVGERGAVELVGLVGFFSTVGLLLNLAEPEPASALAGYSPDDES